MWPATDPLLSQHSEDESVVKTSQTATRRASVLLAATVRSSFVTGRYIAVVMNDQSSDEREVPDSSGGRSRRFRAWRVLSWAGLVLVGVVVGRLFPPFALDWPWLGTFVTSPGLGGLAAVCAAIIALSAALYTSRRSAAVATADRVQRDRLARGDREQRELAEQRAQWWTRFTWAADRAVQAETAELGISVLSQLIDQDWVTVEDNEIAIAVADVIQPVAGNVTDEAAAAAAVAEEEQ